MSRVIHVFRQPERFVAGTVGEPGDRSFYLQAIEDSRTVSVLLEKQQVSVLAERAEKVVSAGRPPCPLCAEPLDPEGHVCVRLNGYHQRTPAAE